ncbi:hypothetical protein FSP39_009142 [Pinctada imbricata]|uniref:Uncharacterized protein n=1 Tax=Pinctada imbricata TaxID=66713 RepID=A0AA88XU20_PINIB|nr:hypothetical protein FSP39_009142 [Pinctada imbricata]
MRLYKALVIPVLLYGYKIWKMNKGDEKLIDVSHNKCFRRIFRIKFEDHVRTERANMRPLSREIQNRRWKLIGYILRQDRNNHCNVALTWAPEGKRKRGRPNTTLRRTVEKEREETGWRSWNEARIIASDRNRWKNSVKALCTTRHGGDR